MTQLFTGLGLGLTSSSLGQLGQYGPKGAAGLGQSGVSTYVNAANGNLVIQQSDGFLADFSGGFDLFQTYNSRGAGAWRFNTETRLSFDEQGILRTDEDGHQRHFIFNAEQNAYLADDGSTARLTRDGDVWVYREGGAQTASYYNEDGQLSDIRDKDGHVFHFSYDHGRLVCVTNTNAKQTITWSFQSGRLCDVTFQSDSQVVHHVHYDYDAQNRLSRVMRDLGDGVAAWVAYDYEGDSNLIRDIRQSDGVNLHFDYDAEARVQRIIDGEGRVTTYAYLAGQTLVTNELHECWTYDYDANNRLTRINGPESFHATYHYDGQHLDSITQGNQHWQLAYNDAGDCIRVESPDGQVRLRTFDAEHRLLSETIYQTFDGNHHPDQPKTSRFMYDDKGHLRFEISASGIVTEYRYNENGLCTSRRRYEETVASATTLDECVLWTQTQSPQSMHLVDYDYDWRGCLSEEIHYTEIDEQGNGVLTRDAIRTYSRFDAAGRLVEKSNGVGVTHYFYDDLGRLTQTVDNQQHIQSIDYDDLHQRVITTDANGLKTIAIYDKSGLLLSTQRLDATHEYGTIRYEYDGAGRLITETDVEGKTSYVFYDNQGRLQGRITSSGLVTEYQYDEDGHCVQTHCYQQRVHLDGRPSDFAAIKPGTTSQDRISQAVYNAYHQLAYQIDASGSVIAYEYDAEGHVLSKTAYANRLAHYQPAVRLNIQDIKLIPSDEDRTLTYYYDGEGQLQAEVNGEGAATSYHYDTDGHLIETIRYKHKIMGQRTGDWTRDCPPLADDIHSYSLYNKAGLKVADIDAGGYLTEYTYNAQGLVTETLQYYERLKPSLVVDAHTLLSSLRPRAHANDRRTIARYNDLNQLIEEKTNLDLRVSYTYDEQGNVLSKTSEDTNTHEARGLQYRYDALGRITQSLDALGVAYVTAHPDVTQSEIETLWQQHGIRYTYDGAGRLLSQTNALNETTRYVYNDDGLLAFTISATGAVTETRYNTFQQIEATIRYSTYYSGHAETVYLMQQQMAALSNPQRDEVTHYEYNVLGQLISHRIGNGAEETVTYNAFGERSAMIQHSSTHQTIITDYQYDHQGLWTRRTEDVGGVNKTFAVEYDAFGWVQKEWDPRLGETTYQRDHRGLIIITHDRAQLMSVTQHDAFGRITFRSGQQSILYKYDDQTHTVTLQYVMGTGTVLKTQYNALGDKLSFTDGNNQTTTYHYDALGQLVQVDAPEHTSTTYTYDAVGHVMIQTDSSGRIRHFTYDAEGHVLTQVDSPEGLAITTTYTYDALGRQLQVINAGLCTQLSYDERGNLIQMCQDPEGLHLTTGYEYNEFNQLIREVKVNPEGRDHVLAYTRDALGRCLTRTIDPDGLQLTTVYTYDANDNVIAERDANQHTTYYVYNASNQVRYQVNAKGLVTEHRYTQEGFLIQTITYARAVEVTSSVDEATFASMIELDADDRYQVFSYDGQGRLTQSCDALGYMTEYRYDMNDNVVFKRLCTIPVSLSALQKGRLPSGRIDYQARKTYFAYDGLNRERFRIEPETFLTESRYDDAGWLIQQIRYERSVGNAFEDYSVATLEAHLKRYPQRSHSTYYAFDNVGRLMAKASSEGVITTYEYDAAGNQIASCQQANALTATELQDANWVQLIKPHADSRTTRAVYDAAGRECVRISPTGRAVERRYDAVGNVIAEMAYANNDRHTSQFEYDAAGRLSSKTDVANHLTRYTYDNNNNVIAQTDASQHEWHYRYNELNQLIETKAPMTTVSDYRNGVLQEETRSIITQNDYDSFGNIIKVIRDVDGLNQTTHYTFDGNNRLRQTLYPNVAVNNPDSTASRLRNEYTQTLSEEIVYNAFGDVIETRDKAGHSRHFIYDNLGQPIFTVDAEGSIVHYKYDAFGNAIEKITFALPPLPFDEYTVNALASALQRDEHDRTETYVYDKDHHLIEVRKDVMLSYNSHTGYYKKLSPTTRFTYNAFGEVTCQAVQLTDTDWAVTRHEYDGDGLIIATLDAEQYLTTYAYNAWGLLSDEIQYTTRGETPAHSPNDRQMTYRYDAQGQLIEKTLKQVKVQRLMGNGSATETITQDLISRYGYDALGHVVSTTDPAGNTAYTYYNAAGQVSAKVGMTTQSGRSATTYQYDALGQLVESHQWANGALFADETDFALKAASADDVIHSDRYDDQGHLIEQHDGNGHTVYYSFDANGHIARTWQILSQVNGSTLLVDKRYHYDGENRLTKTTTLKSSGDAITEDIETNRFGEVIQKSVNGKFATHFDYDQAGRVWRSNTQGYYQIYVYDLSDHITQIVTSTNAGTQYGEQGLDLSNPTYETHINFYNDALHYDFQRQDNQYNALGFLIGSRQDASTSRGGPNDQIIQREATQTQEVDRFGNLLSHTNALGYTTRYDYNALNICIQQDLPEVKTVDEHGQAHTIAPTIHYAVDALGRTIAMTDALGHVVAHVFDAEGKIVQDIDARGARRDKTYNTLGQLTAQTNELGGITRYTYDHANRLLSVITPQTATHYEYDEAGQLIRQTDSSGTIQTMQYNELGELVTQTGQNGTMTYEYDEIGHKTAERDALNHVSTWRYDENGRVQEHIDLGGHKTSYTYNSNGLILSEKSSHGKDIQYHYYSDGQLREYADNAHTDVVKYGYDLAGNVEYKSAYHLGDWAVETDRYQYDALGRLIQVRRRTPDDKTSGIPDKDHALLSIDYEYDGAGNIRDTRVTANYTGYQATSHTDYFRYDENNRMIINKGSLINGDINITSAQGSVLSYDNAGHIIDASTFENGLAAHYTYFYNTDHQLEIIRKNDQVLETKHYTNGQMDAETLYNNNGIATQYNTLIYEKGRLSKQTTKDQYGQDTIKTSYAYDDIGNLTGLTTQVLSTNKKTPGYTQIHRYRYALWDSYLQETDDVSIESPGYATRYGKSTHIYNVNGQLEKVEDQQPGINNNTTEYLTSSMDGIRARKDKNGQTSYLNVAGKTIGDLRLNADKSQRLDIYGGFTPVGSAEKTVPGGGFLNGGGHHLQSTNDFLQQSNTTDGALPNAPQDNLGAYTIKAGDTLESIALQIYGDSSLWYLIADANGITDRSARAGEKGSQLHIGLRLNIQGASSGQHHTNATHNILSSRDILGDTSATIGTSNAAPSTKNHHHTNFWKTMAKISTAIIGAVAMVMSAGMLATLIAPGAAAFGISSLITGGLSVLGGATAELGTAATLGIGFAAGFVGSLVGQGAANAMHLQKGIDLNGALLTGLATAATAGLGKLLNGSSVYKDLRSAMDTGPLNKVFSVSNATEMMERNALSQSLNLALSHHQHFDWLELGVSSATAGIMGGSEIKGINNKIQEKIGSSAAILTSEVEALATGRLTNSHFDATEILKNNLGSAIASGLFAAGAEPREEAVAENTEMAYCPIPKEEEPNYTAIPAGTYERFHEEAQSTIYSADDDALNYGTDLFNTRIEYQPSPYSFDEALSNQINLKGSSSPKYWVGGSKLWANASKEQVRDSMSVDILLLDPVQKMQFMDLHYQSGISAVDLDKLLKDNKVLKNKGAIFLKASKDNNINPIYLISHALHETGKNISELAKNNNFFGMGAIDGRAKIEGVKFAKQHGWSTPELGIMGAAKIISEKWLNNSIGSQRTLYGMRWNPMNPGKNPQYATDIGWARMQAPLIYDQVTQFQKNNPAYRPFFIVPKYR